MKEYWEITQERAVASLAVWGMKPEFELRNLTRAGHSATTQQLSQLATNRAQQEGDLSDARAVHEELAAKLHELIVRVPGIIEGMLLEEDALHDQLDLVFAVDANVSEASDLRRARLLVGLWADFNAQLAALQPPKPALIVPYKIPNSDGPASNVGQADFGALITLCETRLQEEANAVREVSKAKAALRGAERKVDRDNKRWYLAWMKMYPVGTPEGDAAKTQVPTEEGVAPPVALEIATLTVNVDRTVTLLYPENGGEHATTLELQSRLPGDADFGHTMPVLRPQQTVGPFPGGRR